MTRTDEFAELSDLLARSYDDADDPARFAATRRRRRAGWIAALLVLALLVGIPAAYVAATLSAPLPAASVTVDPPEVISGAPVALALPGVGAAAVSITGTGGFSGDEVLDGSIIAASGSTDPLPIASISKLITALVIVDAKPLGPDEDGPTITFTEADDDLYDKYFVAGATVQSMKAGSTLSERDALELMLVVSASNYAEATATWAFGSTAGFARAARTWIANNGLTGTSMVEPTGLDPRNVSTTTDLIAIGKIAAANPTIAVIVGSPNIDVPGFDRLRNNNDMLGVEGVTGLKTGTLEQAGSCLLFTALVDTGSSARATVVGVVLGASDRGAASAAVGALIASISDGFHDVQVLAEGDDLGAYTTAWGDEARVVAGRRASLRTWSDAPISGSTPTTTPVTTSSSGAEVGSLTFTSGGQTEMVPLLLEGDIVEPDAWWRLTNPDVLLGW